jgi:putative long chain acyl-CoA synthase
VYSGPIRDALGDLTAVDLAVAYGVKPPGAEDQIAVAAATLRRGHRLTARDIARALAGLDRDQHPAIVQVVQRIPVTTWYRPITAPLRDAGLPEPGDGTQAWYRDSGRDSYRKLTPAAYEQLVGVEPARPAS